MRSNKLLLIIFSIFFLTSCGPFIEIPNGPTTDSSSETESADGTESETESESSTDTESADGTESETESESSEEETPIEPTEVFGTVEFYSINDFHGAINNNIDDYGNVEMGILKVGSFLKKEKLEGNAIVINSGDYWQGTLESNINKGRLLTEVANEVQFDAMTIGNHEFDWGHYFIEENAKLKSNDGYSTPILGANIYNYDINSKKVLDYADLGLEYTISELDNGIKVGIIGYIGPGQISSITSTNVDHLSFVEPFSIIKNLSTKLRNKGCHIVALSGHEEANEIASLSSGSDKVTNYVDVIFGAHTHDWEIFTSNGVPCIQSGDNGISVGKIVLNYSKSGISVATHTNLNDNNINVDIDNEIQAIYDKYNDEIVEVSNSLVATFDSAPTRANASYIMTAGLADYALENNLNVSYTLINNARTSIDNKNATYSDLYKAYCFDNVVYIAEVSGRDLSYELKYGYFYRLDPEPLNTSKTYKIAVIDYVLCHRDDNREYDNFTNFNIIGRYEKVGSELYTYRDVCIDWLLSLKGTTISTSYFTKNSNFHNYNSVTSKVTLSNHPYVHKDS